MSENTKAELVNGKVMVSADILASIFRVSTMTISNWVAKGMPRASVHTYDVAECVQWHKSNISRPSKRSAEERKLELQCRKLEDEERERNGRLVDVKEVLSTMATIHIATKQKLQLIPRKLALQCQGQEAPIIEALLAKEIHNALNELSNYEVKVTEQDKQATEKEKLNHDKTRTEQEAEERNSTAQKEDSREEAVPQREPAEHSMGAGVETDSGNIQAY